MDIINKVLVGMIIIAATIVSCIGIMNATLKVTEAQNYKSSTVVAIENSNYNTDVINSCISEGDTNGFTVRIITYDTDSNTVEYNSSNTATDTSTVYMATVLIDYEIPLPFVSSIGRTIRGNAH